jgi:hypothetical protein
MGVRIKMDAGRLGASYDGSFHAVFLFMLGGIAVLRHWVRQRIEEQRREQR